MQDLLDTFRDKPASFAPGEKAAYSNSNYILLGAITKKVIARVLALAASAMSVYPLIVSLASSLS